MRVLETERPLGELCEFQRGLTYGKSDEVALSESVVLRANNIDLETNRLDLSDLRYIAPSVHVPELKKTRPGALLICTASGSKTHLGKVAYIDADYGYAFGGFMGQLVPASGVDGRYLFHALTSPRYKAFIAELSDGLNINNLKFDDLRRFQIPVPGVEEQRRIVAILDEAFEGIATAKAHAEKNLRNAREVQDTYVAALFSTAQDWTVGSLSSFVESISTGPFGSMLHKSDYVDAGVPLVNPINIVAGSIVPTKEKQVDGATAMRLRSYLLRSGDIVVGRRGEIGRCAVVSDTQDGWLCGTGCFFIRPSSQIESSFIAHLIRSAPYRARLEALSTGATMQNLSNDALSGLEVALPGRAEQKRLLAAIDAVSFEADHLCEIYQRKLAALDELKQSLLHQAFSGQL